MAQLLSCCLSVTLLLAHICISPYTVEGGTISGSLVSLANDSFLCPKPQCQDFTTDCRTTHCSSDYGKVWCASTCDTCYMRDRCFNALGDAACDAKPDLCLVNEFYKQICKKTCTSCVPQINDDKPPGCDVCRDLLTNCTQKSCTNDLGRVLCTKTCNNTCQLRDKCFNAFGDAECEKIKDQCSTDSITRVICRKTCTGCVEPCPDPTCQDLTTDCRDSHCATDYGKVWCASTCKTCWMRDRCFNALSDSECNAKKDLCLVVPFYNYICKRTCSGCTPVPGDDQPPICGDCRDLFTTCSMSDCVNDYGRVSCAKTCNACILRDKCFNAYGDANCENNKGLCNILPSYKVICKKTCTQCNESTPCKDLTTDCPYKPVEQRCTTHHQKVWCAQTCNQCSMRDVCFNASGDDVCSSLEAIGLCGMPTLYMKVTCKSACGAC